MNISTFSFQKTRHSEAESWFSKANRMAPEDPSVHLHYGLFLMDSERNLEAAREFAKASKLNPEDYESVFNAGVAYRQAGRNTEAEMFYRKAVQIRPQVMYRLEIRFSFFNLINNIILLKFQNNFWNFNTF